MSRMQLCKKFVLPTVIALAVAGDCAAQATRTWVSGVGDDANPCSRTAPCKTFAGAISKTAAGGEIDALDPGGFGAVTITKAITIDGGGFIASALASGTNGVVISAGATDAVVLRNLQINGAGTSAGADTRGIKFLAGASLVVEHCDISRFGKRGISIESSTPNAVATIIDSSVHDNLNNGIVVNPPTAVTNFVVLDRVRAVNNLAFGVGTNPGSVVQVLNSVISNNLAGGLVATGATVDLTNSLVTSNGIGISSSSSGNVRIGGTTVTGNSTAFSISGGVVASYGDNYLAGTAFGLSTVSKQ